MNRDKNGRFTKKNTPAKKPPIFVRLDERSIYNNDQTGTLYIQKEILNKCDPYKNIELKYNPIEDVRIKINLSGTVFSKDWGCVSVNDEGYNYICLVILNTKEKSAIPKAKELLELVKDLLVQAQATIILPETIVTL